LDANAVTKLASQRRSAPKRASQKAGAALSKGERTRATIKQAIRDLIDERQSLEFTLEDICEKTGLTVGAFYFHFENKDAATEEMTIDHLRAFYNTILGGGAEADLETLSRLVLRASIDACVRSPAVVRASYMLVPRSYAVYEAWLDSRSKLARRLVDLLAEQRGRAKPETPDHVDVHVMLSGLEGFLENLFFGADAAMKSIPKRPPRLEEELWGHWRAVLSRRA
jgi:AcrR family transcriptional regulator